MIATVASTASGCSTSTAGLNSMPTETKNSTAKASRSGSASSVARWLSFALAQHHAGEEGAQREGDVEQLRRAEGDAERDRIDREAEQLARAGMRGVVHDPGDHPAPDHQHHRDEGRDLGQRDAERRPASAAGERAARWPSPPPPTAGSSTSASDHREVLDDQPADGDAAALGLERSAAPAGRAPAPRCWRPRARGRRPAPRARSQPSASGQRRRPSASRRRSARRRPARRCARRQQGPSARNAARRRTSAG